MSRGICALLVCAALATHPAIGAALTLHGAGATFPQPVYARWATAYKSRSGVDVVYEAVGSGAGVDRIAQGTVDFGATDIPLTADELQRLQATQFPTVIGGIVPIVNLVGIRPGALRLSGPVLADIYLGKVTRWNAPAIASLNPTLNLPSSRITVVHRADSSGTTHLWSEFLAISSPAWRMAVGVGNTVAWPTGSGAIGNEGVAASVQRTKAAIGYVEQAYARQHHLAGAAVRNHDGVFVQADPAAFEAAAQQVRWVDASDLQPSLIDLPGAASWPLVSASFVLLPRRSGQSAQTQETIKFFDWALSQGQSLAAELDYVPLPAAAVDLVRRTWMAQHPDAAPQTNQADASSR